VVELAGKEKLEVALSLAKRLAGENDLMDALPELEQLLKNFWESDLQKELTDLPAFQEVPFLLEDGGKLWRGKIDLVLRSKDGLRLVDLKTDRIKPEQVTENNEKYRKQMEVYRKALAGLKDQKLMDASILYLKPGVRSKI
jgi:ATP-dependent exoDNAse (exonuclease V) beta subunit